MISKPYMFSFRHYVDGNKADFSAQGPFIGAAGIVDFDKGRLVFKLSAAFMTSEFDRTVFARVGSSSTAYNVNYSETDTFGFSYDIGWTAPIIPDKLSYSISLGGYEYEFDKFIEKMFYLRMGLVYTFGFDKK